MRRLTRTADRVEQTVKLVDGHTDRELPHVRELFGEYAAWLGFDLSFQGFDGELDELPGEYRPPSGCLVLAYCGEHLAGCCGLRPFKGDICEMKRLYVREKFRGRGVARALTAVVIARARSCGYRSMRLDTVPWMKEAIALYESLGFVDIAPYRDNPIEGARFMELPLAP